jgi:hypothetical protein
MITQQEFVDCCYKFYGRKGLEPGNPLHGEWHKAHYPVPESLGGVEWIWLLKNHHAIQGVIQSEEFQTCCLFYWEQQFLSRYYLSFFLKWKKIQKEEVRGKLEEGWRKWFESEEGQQKRRSMGINAGEMAKRVNSKAIQISFDDGRQLTFASLTDASRELNIHNGRLSDYAKGRIKLQVNFTATFL